VHGAWILPQKNDKCHVFEGEGAARLKKVTQKGDSHLFGAPAAVGAEKVTVTFLRVQLPVYLEIRLA
jgi:hypothetical protein